MKPNPRLLIGLAVAALAIGAVEVPFLLESDNGDIPPGIWAALTLFVGWGFVGAGLVAWWGQPENRTGRLMVFTGYLWFVGSLQGFEDPWVYSISSLFGAERSSPRRSTCCWPSRPASWRRVVSAGS